MDSKPLESVPDRFVVGTFAAATTVITSAFGACRCGEPVVDGDLATTLASSASSGLVTVPTATWVRHTASPSFGASSGSRQAATYFGRFLGMIANELPEGLFALLAVAVHERVCRRPKPLRPRAAKTLQPLKHGGVSIGVTRGACRAGGRVARKTTSQSSASSPYPQN